MSRHPKAKTRDALDRYYTPEGLAEDLVAQLRIKPGALVAEPSAGRGAFVRALQRRGAQVAALDADPDTPWKTCRFEDLPEVQHDWIVGNPPYRAAQEHTEKALRMAPRVAFLLRAGFATSLTRRAFWEDPARGGRLERVIMLGKRPSFSGDGKTDGSDYAFFVFGPSSRQTSLLDTFKAADFSILYPRNPGDWRHL